jgi:putative ABC transport system substrate-binding protein
MFAFVCCFLLSACMPARYNVETQKPQEIITPRESQESQESQEITQSQESQGTIIVLNPPKPLKVKVPPLVLLFDSHESEQYDLTMRVFKEQLTQYLPQAEYMYHTADNTAKFNAYQFVSPKTKSPPAIIISLGATATKIAQAVFSDTPILATMMISEGNMLHPKENNSVIILQIPVEIQLQWIKKLLPNARRIGILYDPALNRTWMGEALKAAQRESIEIIAYEINSPKQLQAGLSYMSNNADVLMAIPDQTVYSGKTAKEILLFSYRNHLPFIGLSSSWVKAGALYAIEIDYEDLGRQVAGLANRILTEGSTGKTNVFHAAGVNYSLNMKTKEYLQLKIDNDVINGASIVFE